MSGICVPLLIQYVSELYVSVAAEKDNVKYSSNFYAYITFTNSIFFSRKPNHKHLCCVIQRREGEKCSGDDDDGANSIAAQCKLVAIFHIYREVFLHCVIGRIANLR